MRVDAELIELVRHGHSVLQRLLIARQDSLHQSVASAASTISCASRMICAQMVLAAKALGVDLVDVLGARRPRGEPAVRGDHLDAADRRVVARRARRARARSSRRPARRRVPAPATASRSRAFCSASPARRRGRTRGSPNSRVSSRYSSPGSRPVRAVISAASSAGTMPSLSVVHTVPSRRRNDAPALSSPPKPSEPSSRPSTNHLKPTGTSYSRRPEPARRRGRSSRC